MIKINKDRRIIIQKEKFNYIVKCLFCKNHFKIKKSRFKKGEGKFCAPKCYWNFMKGRKTKSSTKFKKGLIPWTKGRKGIHLSFKTEFKSGKLHPKWKPEGYKYSDKTSGYKMIKCSIHPKANQRGYALRSDLVASFCLQRMIKKETIHHINEIKSDDRPSNLFVFPDKASHSAYHLLKNKGLVEIITVSNLPTISELSLPDILKS